MLLLVVHCVLQNLVNNRYSCTENFVHGKGEKEVEGIGRRREVGREGGREEKEGGEEK